MKKDKIFQTKKVSSVLYLSYLFILHIYIMLESLEKGEGGASANVVHMANLGELNHV